MCIKNDLIILEQRKPNWAQFSDDEDEEENTHKEKKEIKEKRKPRNMISVVGEKRSDNKKIVQK